MFTNRYDENTDLYVVLDEYQNDIEYFVEEKDAIALTNKLNGVEEEPVVEEPVVEEPVVEEVNQYIIEFNPETELYVILDQNGKDIEYFASEEQAIDTINKLTGKSSFEPKLKVNKEVLTTSNESIVQVDIDVSLFKKKSDVVREAIKQVKQQHGEMTQVIEFAVTNLGMTKQLAKTYTKNNWDKV